MTVSSGSDLTGLASDSESEDLKPIAAAREKYRPELDGIRAICIIFTIFNHVPNCPWWLNGVAGVAIFFPLSGWLITSLLVREHQENGNVNLRSFWIRRIFRIIPLYYITVLIYVSLSLTGAKNGAAQQLHSAFVYMATMNMEYRPFRAGSLFGHAWTLGIEEKFYLVWPLILASLIRKPAAAGLVAGAAFIALIMLFGYGGTLLLGYLGLGVGSGLSLLSLKNRRFRDFIANDRVVLIFFFAMLLSYSSFLLPEFALSSDILLAISSAFVIASLWFSKKSWLSKFLCLNPLPWLGRLTYAIYLIQSLCVRLVVDLLHVLHVNGGFLVIFILGYAVAITFAFVMHRFIELPMIRLGKSLASRYATATAVGDMSGAKTAGKL